MPEETQTCPKCERDCWRESVDVGIGIQYGPWGCECGWSESDEYSLLDENKTGIDAKGGFTDQWGVHYPPGNIRAIMERAGRRARIRDTHRWDYPYPSNNWERMPWWMRWPVLFLVVLWFVVPMFLVLRKWWMS